MRTEKIEVKSIRKMDCGSPTANFLRNAMPSKRLAHSPPHIRFQRLRKNPDLLISEIQENLIRLEERARIMRDIHDGVGGHLVALLGAAKREQLDSKAIEAMAQDALVDFRIAIDSMSPTETDLVTTLANLRFRLQPRLAASQLASDWKFDEFPPDLNLSREVLFHLQRIVAEAITNIAKHARGATRADVAVKWDAAHLRVIIEISDDGAGFAQDLIAGGGGRGIANMRTRAGLAGGELELISASAGSGAMVRLLIPAEIGARV